MNGFYNTYQNIFIALKNPVMGRSIDTPANPHEWKRFFGMMDALERAEIAIFQNGRYLLHPKRKADVVAQAEAILAEISKPLTLPEPEAEVVTIAAPLMPEFNVCPTCKGKGRVQIEDEPGFFGSYLCLTCMGKKQIPVPSRDTFPPVDLSRNPKLPNALLFSDNPKQVAPIPQALEVGGVRVIVEAPAPVLSVIVEEVKSETLVAVAEPVVKAAVCLKCGSDDMCHEIGTEPACDLCIDCCRDKNGPADVEEDPIENFVALRMMKLANDEAILNDDTQPLPELVSADCPTCTGSGMAFDALSEAPYIRVQSCPDCGGSGEMQEIPLVDVFADFDTSLDAKDSPSDELIIAETIEPIDAMGDGGFVWHDKLEQPTEDILALIQQRTEDFTNLENSFSGKEREAIQKERVILKSFVHQLVRVNWTGRGLSSGQFQLLSVIRQYGKNWYLVKVETDTVYFVPVLPSRCEMVAPKTEAKAITPVVAPKPNLLDGLPVMQAIATHGIEDTKAALNVVHQRVVAEVLNANNLLVAEGQV